MLDKKQIWVIFLFEFKMGCETVEATCNINNTFGSEAAKEQTVQWWVKKFCKGDESLEGKEQSRQPSEVDNNQLRGSSRQILLQRHKRLPKNSALIFLWSYSIWSKLERWKKLNKWVPYEPAKSEKNIILASRFLLFCATTKNHFSIGLWYATKSGFYTTTGNDQLSCWTEKKLQSTSQSQSCTKKRSAVIGLLPVWSTTAIWIPVKLFYLKSMLSKSMRCPVNCNACSQHLSTERARFFSMTTPYCTSHNQHFESWTDQATKFCLIRHTHLTSHQTTTTSSSISIPFCRENASTISRRQKMQRVVESQRMDFHATGINLFLIGKNVLLLMVTILINKDIFESSYNDLKFMVRNCNYTCTNIVTPCISLCIYRQSHIET